MTDCLFAAPDLIADAQARFDALTNYETTVRSTPSAGVPVEVRYCYRKPGFIRMDFIRPHAGAVLAYNPETDKVTLWPFGFHTFPRLALAPDNPLIQGPNAHRIDRSDIGALLGHVRELQRHGETQIAGHEAVGSRQAVHLVISGAPEHDAAGDGCYQLWLDVMTGLPIKVISADGRGELIETVLMEDLRVDLPEIEPFL
jgi:outer membrane lipoprotein-sorting protein